MAISKDSFHTNPDPMWIFESGSDLIIDINQAALDLFALKPDEIVGRSARSVCSPHWTISGKSLISRAASHQTGRATKLRIMEVELDGQNTGLRLAMVPKEAVDAAAIVPAGLSDDVLHRLLEYLPHSVLILRPEDYKILGVSDAFLRLVARDRQDLVGKNLLDLWPDHSQEQLLVRSVIQASLELVKKTGKQDIIPVFCYVPPRRSEAEYYWAASNTPVFDSSGNIDFIIYQVEEVASSDSKEGAETTAGGNRPADEQSILTTIAQNQELKKVNQQLREKEAYLSNVQSLLEIANWQFDYRTGEIQWSDNASSVLRLGSNRPPKTLNEHMDLIHPEDRDRVRSIFQSFREGEEPQLSFSYRLQSPETGDVFLRGKGTLVESPKGMTLTGVVQNITREWQAGSEMDLLRQCVSRVNDIIIVTEAEPIEGPDGPKILFVNEAFERLTGYTVAEAIGRTPRILQGPGTEPQELRRIKEALKSWKPIRSEILNYTKDGSPIWIEMDIVPVANESGWYTHWISIERDVTERRKVEE